jgi:TPR repeat protein
MAAVKDNTDYDVWPENKYSAYGVCLHWLKNEELLNRKPQYLTSGSKAYFEKTLKMAENGDVDAQYDTAMNYFLGQGVAPNSEKNFEWMLKAARGGHMDAQYQVALKYENEKAQIDEAIKWHYAAAMQGNIRSAVELGRLLHGKGFIPQAAQWFEYVIKTAPDSMVKEKGEAMTYMGHLLIKGLGVEKNFDQGLKLIQQAAEYGSVDAAAYLGRTYIDGLNIPADYTNGYFWLILSMKLGAPPDTQMLALATKNLTDAQQRDMADKMQKAYSLIMTRQDEQVQAENKAAGITPPSKNFLDMGAAERLQDALKHAEEGIADAQYFAADYYMRGVGTEPSEEKAVEWFTKAANQGHVNSMNRLAEYHRSKGSKDVALQWFVTAAKKNSGPAQVQIGMIAEAQGDIATAVKWYKVAIANTKTEDRLVLLNDGLTGTGEAFGHMGMLLINAPTGIKKDAKAGHNLIKTGARLGSGYCAQMLGQLNAEGKIIKQDYQQSLFWLLYAIKTRIPEDKELMQNIRSHLSGKQQQDITKKVEDAYASANSAKPEVKF